MRRRYLRQIEIEILRQVNNERQSIVSLSGAPSIAELSQALTQHDFGDTGAISGSVTIADLLKKQDNFGAFSKDITVGALLRRGPIFDEGPEYETYLSFKLPKPYIEFHLTYGSVEKGNGGEVRIWNLDDETLDQIEEGDIMLVKAGHRDNPPIQTLCPGSIDKFTSQWNGVDRITTFTLTDSGNEWMTRQVWYHAAPGVSAREALWDLVEQVALPIRHYQLGHDLQFPQGLTYKTHMTVKQAIESVADAAGSKAYIMNGGVYLQPEEASTARFIEDLVLNKDGWYRVIGRPEILLNDDPANNMSAQWQIPTLLDSIFEVGVSFRVDTEEVEAIVEIVELELVADRNRFYSILKLAPVTEELMDIPVKPTDQLNITLERTLTPVVPGTQMTLPKRGDVLKLHTLPPIAPYAPLRITAEKTLVRQ